MRSSFGRLICLTLVVITGVGIAFQFAGGRGEHLPYILPFPAAPEGTPIDSAPVQNQDIEVIFINDWNRVPIPLDTPTVLDRGDLLTEPKGGGGGWETKAIRTTTQLTITHESDIGRYRKLEHTVPLSDLPMDFPHDKIRTMVNGRFEVVKNESKPGPVP